VAEWIDHVMISNLENNLPPFSLAVMGKENWCGTSRVQQLLLRMEASRKTVVLLTDKFAITPQCRYILSVLEEWIFTDGENKSVIILFNQNIFKKQLHFRRHRSVLSVLKYPGLNQSDYADIAFWEMLRLALLISNKNETSSSRGGILRFI